MYQFYFIILPIILNLILLYFFTVFNPGQLIERKSNLFGLVLATVIGFLAIPVILPHFLHGYHMVHIVIHIAGVTLAVFMTVLSALAYYRLKTKKMILTLIAFGVFVNAEIITLIDATWPTVYDIGYMTLGEIGHVLIIATLGILAIGVFRND